MRNVEGVLSAQGDGTRVAEELILAEVQACVQCLYDVATPGEDGFTTPLFKACLEGIEWLHRVIMAVWCVGQASVAWKQALVVPFYKGKGSSTNNYRVFNIPSKVYTMLLMHRVRMALLPFCSRLASKASSVCTGLFWRFGVWVGHRWLGSRPWWCPSIRARAHT